MDSIVVKTEMQSNGEILLFYVDENGGNEEGVLTTVESIENQAMQLQQDNSYIIQDMVDSSENTDQSTADNWTDDEINRLLVFYNDNKQTFINGTTKKQHLWTVACKTMLLGKNPNSCEAKLLSLQTKYNQICENIQKGLYEEWPYFQLCHNIFQDESPVITIETVNSSEPQIIKVPALKQNFDNVMMVKKINKPAVDEKVHTMLTLYLKYKKNFQEEYWRRGLWETIAMEMGEDDGEYWQKRFLNYKQHYLRLLDKRRDSGNEGINWPYMDLFDKIFEGDQEFNRKYLNEEYRLIENQAIADSEEIPTPEDWLVCEKTVLVKYYFDCYDEFEDRTIPNGFLWNEIGRLLDKPADDCKAKYEELREAHLQKYIDGAVVDLQSRKPVDIVYDHIISKDIQNEMERNRRIPEELEIWKTTELDDLVQFFYDNIQLYKDKICHFVCWAAVAKKLKKTLQSCKSQWDDLVQLYQTILNDKKEHPDMQIDWRYIEVFDRIFDYGMDTNLLVGYDKPKDGAGPKAVQESELGKVGVKRVSIKEEVGIDDFSDDDESFDERGFTKRTKRRAGESKAFKILEYYQKNKDKFSTTNRNKHSLWEVLAKQIGISATQCAHRFRNLKQVYTAYVQREINKPEMPILWPYYALCKKVFGYRAIKSKLKNGKMDSDDSEDWSAKEIKQLINYFAQNFEEIDNFVDDTSKWSDLATDIGKTENACKEKFIELRKSYRKLKTMRSRNPDVKISWKYFNMFEDIYNAKQNGNDEAMEVEELDLNMVSDEKEEDDYQCIIVIPEGQDISQIENAQIIIQDPPTLETVPEEPAPTLVGGQQPKEVKPIQKWTKRTKKRLIIFYINYIRSHKGKEINAQEMWKDLASKLNKTVQACRKMFAKLKANHKQLDKSDPNVLNNPYYSLMAKAMRLKPKYEKGDQNKSLKDGKVYKDVALPDDKVIQALQYYLENIEDFVSPRYEKKYLWTELANYVCEPITKVFNKLNYLKQQYNSDTDEVAGQKTPFGELLKEIQAKEIAVKLVVDNNPKPIIELPDDEETWSDDETEQLLEWYLSNLEKFKNPKYVRSYLWLEVSELLKKSAIACSKKMSDVRTEYRNMVREKPEELNAWRFLDLCQKIYGTGKKGATNISN